MNNQQKNQRSFKLSSRLIFIGAVLAFLAFVLAASPLIYSGFHKLGAGSGVIGKPEGPDLTEETSDPGLFPDNGTVTVEPTRNLPPIPEAPEWDGTRRVTMLIMGIDYRDWEAGEKYARTDTMMLLTIDPVSMTAGMLSIPRDLWAAIPGFNPAKINTAHYFGDLYNYPGGGPALAVKTVENLLGVPIDYYARIDFNTFVEFIDLIGGVKVDVTETIELEVIGKQVDPVLEPGRYTLDGRHALAYARNRHTEGGDFDRARRQQQVIWGIRDRLLNPKVFPMLVRDAPKIYDQFISGITTNMSFADAFKLLYLVIQVKEEDIEMEVIGEKQILYGTSPDKLAILIPLADKIRELRDKVFATGGAFTPMMSGEPETLMQLEGARIIIVDGSSDSTLAQRTADYLTSLGANVVGIEPAGTSYGLTTLVDHTGSPYTLAFLADLMDVTNNYVLQRIALDSSRDVEIWLGSQWQNDNPIP